MGELSPVIEGHAKYREGKKVTICMQNTKYIIYKYINTKYTNTNTQKRGGCRVQGNYHCHIVIASVKANSITISNSFASKEEDHSKNTQTQIHKHKYTNTQTQIHKHKYTNT